MARKRIEIPAELYDQLAADARQIGLSTQGLATAILTTGLAQYRRDATLSFKAKRDGCAHEWDSQDGDTLTCLKCGMQVRRLA